MAILLHNECSIKTAYISAHLNSWWQCIVRYRPDCPRPPGIAVSARTSPGHKEWTFRLRGHHCRQIAHRADLGSDASVSQIIAYPKCVSTSRSECDASQVPTIFFCSLHREFLTNILHKLSLKFLLSSLWVSFHSTSLVTSRSFRMPSWRNGISWVSSDSPPYTSSISRNSRQRCWRSRVYVSSENSSPMQCGTSERRPCCGPGTVINSWYSMGDSKLTMMRNTIWRLKQSIMCGKMRVTQTIMCDTIRVTQTTKQWCMTQYGNSDNDAWHNIGTQTMMRDTIWELRQWRMTQ